MCIGWTKEEIYFSEYQYKTLNDRNLANQINKNYM